MMSIRVCLKLKATAVFLCTLLIASPASARNCQDTSPNTEAGVLKVRALQSMNASSRQSIRWSMLELALSHANIPYDLGISDELAAGSGRNIVQMIKLKTEGNIRVNQIDATLEKELLPIRIPMFRGLSSYLHVWVRKDDTHRFAEVKTLSDLTKFSILQGHKWRSIQAFEAAGFDVRTGQVSNIPTMLAAGRADAFLFPALHTTRLRKRKVKELGLVPLKHIMISYPIDEYFYVDKCSKDLHDAIYRGLNAAIKNGSHDKLMREYSSEPEDYQHIESGEYTLFEVNSTNLTDESLKALDKYKVDID